MSDDLSAEDLEEFRKGIETTVKIAKRMADLGVTEFKDASEWEFMAGIMTLAAWLSAGVSQEALELAVNLATDAAKNMGAQPKIGLIHDPLAGN